MLRDDAGALQGPPLRARSTNFHGSPPNNFLKLLGALADTGTNWPARFRRGPRVRMRSEHESKAVRLIVRRVLVGIVLAIVLASGAGVRGQGAGSLTAEPSAAIEDALPEPAASERDSPALDEGALTFRSRVFDRFWSIFSEEEDPDGPINTDRPTFTPANTVVPPGRLQFESGFTFDYQQGASLGPLPTIFLSWRCAWESPSESSSGRSGSARLTRRRNPSPVVRGSS